MIIKTVGEIRRYIEGLPDDLPVIAYSERRAEVKLYLLDPEKNSDVKQVLVISTD